MSLSGTRSFRRACAQKDESMPFSKFGLHPDLLRGVKEMGFTRPTPIQEDTIPAAMQGRDVLACAMTGSGKTAAFVLPILHRLMGKPRGKTRALIVTPTRELAAQIDEHLNGLGVHTPLSAAAVFGGVGMGPQEHAFRSGVDVIVATPGRLLDHFRFPYARLDAPRGPRPRRGGPDARHGLSARHPPRPQAPPDEAPDAVLLRDDAGADRARSRARCCTIRSRSTSSGRRPPPSASRRPSTPSRST